MNSQLNEPGYLKLPFVTFDGCVVVVVGRSVEVDIIASTIHGT